MAVGLANPGGEYAGTRHNVGEEVVALLVERTGARLKRAVGRALSAEVHLGGKLLVVAVPGVFMNLSGETVAPLVRRYCPDDLARLVVVHDELDLPLGRIRVKVGGGLAGHNGLKSIKAHLHSDAFVRVRIGVGKPPGRQSGAAYVLRRPGKSDRVELDIAVVEAADAVEAILTDGPERAMNRFN
ncbi:MAG: aminoacyl-tRNA hydrolase [Acidimicrobiia bacterium]|nr:aminoacyl-tRNA hydrolase [Acidimicrobiia bacterium]